MGVAGLYAVIFVGTAGAFGIGFMNLAVQTFTKAAKPITGPLWTIGWVASVLAVLVGVVPVAMIVVREMLGRRAHTPDGSLAAFAQANGLSYEAGLPLPDYPGAIFSTGTRRTATRRLTSTSGPSFELGDFSYDVPAGRTTATHNWGYIALRLDRRLPQILLESVAYGQNTAGALPVAINRSQKLQLEGDFDRYFTLYCPRGFETDALFLLTPDVMALMIDSVAEFDVEIVDDWLFVYSPTDFSTAGEAEYRRLFDIIQMLEAKIVDQAAHYSHDDAEVQQARGTQQAEQAADGVRLTRATSQYSR
ncbi:MAG: hypothetical protein ABJA94_12305, partial [Rhodoglobus sp.]